jgi:hypothetical protein
MIVGTVTSDIRVMVVKANSFKEAKEKYIDYAKEIGIMIEISEDEEKKFSFEVIQENPHLGFRCFAYLKDNVL